MIASPEGDVYYKLYDEYGATYGRVKVGFLDRFRYRKQIKEAVEPAWELKNKLDTEKHNHEVQETTEKTFNIYKNINNSRD